VSNQRTRAIRFMPRQRPASVWNPFGVVHDSTRGTGGDPEWRWWRRLVGRTRAQVICLRRGSALVGSDVVMGWTADISETGTGLELPIPVTDDRFWLRLAGPGNAFIECRVEWGESFPAAGLHRCGVQFERQLTRGEFERVLSERNGAWST
jgi:PilZ domain